MKNHLGESDKSLIPLAAAAAALALVALGVFARVMNYDLRLDELLYVPPIVLLDGMNLYSDVFYNHVPGSAWLFDAVQDAFGAGRLLLTARLVVFAAWLLFGAVVIWSAFRLTRSWAVTVLLCVLLLTNPYLLGPTGAAATNNFLPLPFIYLSFALFVLGVERAEEKARGPGMPGVAFIFAAGLCISIAASLKISAAVFIAPMAAAVFAAGKVGSFGRRLRNVVAPFAAGGAAAAAPLIIVAFRDIESFFAHVLFFNTGPHTAYWKQAIIHDPDVALSLPGKLILSHDILFSGANALLFAALAMIVMAPLAQRGLRKTFGAWGWPVFFAAGAAALSLFAAFLPTPSFPQYFAQPLIAAAFLLALLYRSLEDGARAFVNAALLALALIGAVIGAPRIAMDLPALGDPKSWTVNAIHRDGLAIADELRRRRLDGPVATLFPLYPLEGGLPVYPELATGPFVYRTADLAEPALLAHYVTTSPSRIGERLAQEPPAAILVGFAPALEGPLQVFIAENGYRRADLAVKNRYGEGVLYLRPAPDH